MNKIDKWLFPFLGSDGKEVTEVQRYYAALAQNEDGFYPIGANGLWHGGIHFAAGSGQALKQGAGIRCIADGEVVAYRLNKSYPAVVYPGDAAHPAKYSSGFVLVRHKLVLPPEPPVPVPADTTPPAAPATPAEPPAADILTFYSLYMHVLNADAYDAHPGLDRPVHWAGPAGNKYKVGSKAKDTEPTLAPGKTGIRVRDAQKKVIGLLPQGDIIKLGAALAAHPTYFAVEATSVTAGYVFKAELDPLNTPDPAALNAIYVLPTPKAVKAGDLLGHLGEYQNYQDVTHHPSSRPLLHLEVFSGDDVPAFIARSKARSAKLDAKTKTRLHIHAGARLFEPTPSDLAIPAGTRLIETADSPKSGIWVKATQMVKAIVARNSLTDYKAGTGSSKGSYKHGGKRVEFTGRFFGPTDADVTTDETVRKNLGYNRREIMMPTGEPLWLERSALTSNTLRSGWKNFPLQLSKPSGNVTVLSRVYTRGELDKRPANQVAIDDHNVRWFKHSANGWICEKGNPGAEWESSWDWPGFEVVKETSTPAEHFVRNPHILNAALPNESHNFQQRADAADSTGIFKKVREIMDGIDQSRPDGKLSVSEFKRALKTPWLADQVGRLIVNYESEWGGAATKWDELDSVMLDGVLAWKAEKIRIAYLSFWNGLRGLAGFPSPQVYHFHPVGLVGNFIGGAKPFSWASSCFGDAIAKVESMGGDYNIYNYYKTRKPDVMGMVRGENICSYTLSKIREMQKEDKMFAAGKWQLIPLTLQAAIDALHLDMNSLFDEEMQDRIFDRYLISVKRPPIIKYLEGDGDIEDALYAWALEWASAGIRKGKKMSLRKKIVDGKFVKDENGKVVKWQPVAEVEGVSYYAGDGINRAHITPDAMKLVLEKAKKEKP